MAVAVAGVDFKFSFCPAFVIPSMFHSLIQVWQSCHWNKRGKIGKKRKSRK